MVAIWEDRYCTERKYLCEKWRVILYYSNDTDAHVVGGDAIDRGVTVANIRDDYWWCILVLKVIECKFDCL